MKAADFVLGMNIIIKKGVVSMRKSIISLLLAVVLVIGAMSIGAYAYSNETSTYHFSFSDNQCETDVIKKTGGTSAYVYCSETGAPWYASVGAGNAKYQYKYDENTYSDQMYIAGNKKDAWIKNSVYERGFRGIYLIGNPTESYSYSAHGMWNSDSGSS